MPTYVYECRTCQKTFEVEQRIVEDPLTDCDCGAKGSLRRLIQPTAVMFKGSGFHINDYASPASTVEPAASQTESSSETPVKAPEAATESTPAPAVAPATNAPETTP